MKAGLCCLFIATAVSGIHAFDISLTGLEAELSIKPEFNRVFHFCAGVSLSGALELNKGLTLGGGFSLDALGLATEHSVLAYNAFGRAGFRLPVRFPLELGVSYIYNGFPDYHIGMHTVLPLVTCRWKWSGFSLGSTLRSMVYAQEAAVFEPILAFMVFVNVIATRNLLVGFKAANFSDFLAGNMGAYFLNLNMSIRADERLSIINEIELYQSGSLALAAAFRGIAYRGGIRWQR